jgi:alkanesulfonate monooxygenase SsuD/methylene tetrahydromethanopterin reductase-like flavin-dependent oxidoreductase (luciferase family)
MAPRAEHPLRIGLKLSQDAPIESFRRIWRIADEGGFDHCWAFDHLATIGPIGLDRPVFDGWTLLAAMAEDTKRTRIGLLVTGMTYRYPAVVAKQAVTVDHLSGGRLEFGIGAAWATAEHDMYGIEGLDHRVGRLSEGLQVIKMLWTKEHSDFEGRYYRLRDAIGNPKPVQKPHPPIWIGASGPSVLKIAARHADVWNAAGEAGRSLDVARQAGEQLRAACEELGRNPAEIRWSAQLRFDGGDPEAMIDEIEHWHDAGFSEIVIYTSGEDVLRAADRAADKVLPGLRAQRGLRPA